MANIAIAFHWSPECMERMSLTELADWERLAIEKLEMLHKG
ncbi:MAG: GpE family phage tail protein [Novosphingobium sp.]|nr:GpE family phage tail protein [Novosphingobium sp.]